MATGNRLVPGAPVTAEHTAAGRPVTDEQANWAGWPAQGFAAGPAAAEQAPWAGLSSMPGAAPASEAPNGEVSQSQASRRLWRGAGGRWLVWVFRALLWAVLLLVGYRGVAAIVTGAPVAGGTTTTAARGHGFPVAVAKAYALEFGQAYLNLNPATAQRRASTLAGFVPPGTAPQDGWNGGGTQTLQSEQVAGVRVLNAHRAVVLLLARVNGNLLELAVPIYASAGGLAVSGQPGLFPPPIQAIPPQRASGPADLAARRSLGQVLPAFFRAYASGNSLQLGTFTAHGAPITGLGGVVSFAGIRRLFVPAAAGLVRRIVVTVMWRTGSARPPAAATHAASPSATSSARPSGSASARPSASPSARSAAHPSARPSARPSAGPSASPAASAPAGPIVRPAEIDMTYALTVVRHGGTWLVRWIGPAIVQPWPSP